VLISRLGRLGSCSPELVDRVVGEGGVWKPDTPGEGHSIPVLPDAAEWARHRRIGSRADQRDTGSRQPAQQPLRMVTVVDSLVPPESDSLRPARADPSNAIWRQDREILE
jgi:hypothetical protein